MKGTNDGALFRNDRQGHEKRPDYTGKATIEGVEYELAGWVRESKAGQKFLSLKFSEPRQPEPDDDIPF